MGSPPRAPWRLACSVERVFSVFLVLLLLALVNLAQVANVISPSSFSFSLRSNPNDDSLETVPVYDLDAPGKAPIRVGMAMPARGAPKYHPDGCAFMARHHLEDRFVRDDACFTKTQIIGILRELVIHAAQVFAAHNVTYFLESGTLLGAYRHRDVIPHDFDGDLAIDTAGFEYLRNHKLPFNETLYQMDVWDSPYYENAGRDAKLSARLIHKASALYVDVFVFHRSINARTKRPMVGPVPSDCYSNCVYCTRLKDGRPQLLVPREWVYPLEDCSFGGATLKCPAQTAKYLTHQYGEHFMDPI